MKNELTELEKYILISKDEELFNYFRKNCSYPNMKHIAFLMKRIFITSLVLRISILTTLKH